MTLLLFRCTSEEGGEGDCTSRGRGSPKDQCPGVTRMSWFSWSVSPIELRDVRAPTAETRRDKRLRWHLKHHYNRIEGRQTDMSPCA